MKKILITAGSTAIPIDQVRVISNIFKGSTGKDIALYFAKQDWNVTLITSNPPQNADKNIHLKILKYKTYDELYALMEKEIKTGRYDAVVHSAAVSDYAVKQTLIKNNDGNLEKVDSTTKISSDHASLFLELVPTKKIIDMIRPFWGFAGQLIKFKLQVGICDQELLEIGRKSLTFSRADWLVANCLEWSRDYAYIINKDGQADKIERNDLPKELYRRLR
jgi:phosphopantothenate---cysteine ligase (CTP)